MKKPSALPNLPDQKHEFIFGTATSSYQIEGDPEKHGGGRGIWPDFCRQPGKVHKGESGDTAIDHYSHWREDLDLMKSLGIESYRLSLSWPRLMPDGTGRVNPDGVRFYRDILQRLHELDIVPLVTLYHWDLPSALQEKGGWANPEMVQWFADYTRVVLEELGDLNRNWLTLNEPWVFLHMGMITGEHAPGITDIRYAAGAYRTILFSHSAAVRVIREVAPDHLAGVACNFTDTHPADSSEENRKTARLVHSYHNELFLDPWVNGRIPEAADVLFSKFLPEWTDQDLEIITEPMDFLGINYYTRQVVKREKGSFLDSTAVPPEGGITTMGWEVYPQGLADLLTWASDRYKLPLYVTENGSAWDDEVEIKVEVEVEAEAEAEVKKGNEVEDDFEAGSDVEAERTDSGRIVVADQRRMDYLREHVEACLQAKKDGADIRGYYVWSFFDNFEWAMGYDQRFGIVRVDYETMERTVKQSGYLYREIIERYRG